LENKGIIIADDHSLFLEGLQSVLEKIEGVKVLAAVTNGRELIDSLQTNIPDIILLDLNMPHLDGIETLKIIKSQFPKIIVIVLTSYFQPELMREIKLLGANGYLSKNSSANRLKLAIEAVSAGSMWFADDFREETSPSHFFIDDFLKKYQLTRREVEIIRMAGKGLTSKVISQKLFVSEFTINTHRRNISRKLDIHTPLGLLKFAQEHRLV
jgi:DNA-binding NarL/FixJ family response regulator